MLAELAREYFLSSFISLKSCCSWGIRPRAATTNLFEDSRSRVRTGRVKKLLSRGKKRGKGRGLSIRLSVRLPVSG